MFATYLCGELIYNWLEVNGLQTGRTSFSTHMSESQFKRCWPIVLQRSLFINFSLKNERSPVQLVTIMHIATISTLGYTDFKYF